MEKPVGDRRLDQGDRGEKACFAPLPLGALIVPAGRSPLP